MKKQFLLPMLAVVVAVATVFAASAFAIKGKNADKLNTTHFWELKQPGLDPTDPGNYQRYEGTMPGCGGSSDICVIEAPSDVNNQPDIAQVAFLIDDLENFWYNDDPTTVSGAVSYKN